MSTQLIDVPASRLAWLESQLAAWQAAGLVEERQAQAIRSQYTVSRRYSLGRLALYLGGGFIGIGVLWLIAANLDQISPGVRFAAIAAFWVATTAGAEALAVAHRDERSPLVGAVRGLAALAFGGTIMQAAQSLQVPAWEPVLVGLWGLGALIHAYAVRATSPLLVGIVMGTLWAVWQYALASEVVGVVVALLTLGLLGIGAAALHRSTQWPTQGFASLWRVAGALGLLAGAFVAALPLETDFDLGLWYYLLPVAALVVLLAAAALAGHGHRLEMPLAGTAAALAVVLLAWETTRDPWSTEVGAADWLHAILAVGGYLVLATGVAAWGVLHDQQGLTWVAVAALVLFTIVQSFTVFAAIIEGAWLFVALGTVLLASGWLVDRGRRRLVAMVEEGTA